MNNALIQLWNNWACLKSLEKTVQGKDPLNRLSDYLNRDPRTELTLQGQQSCPMNTCFQSAWKTRLALSVKDTPSNRQTLFCDLAQCSVKPAPAHLAAPDGVLHHLQFIHYSKKQVHCHYGTAASHTSWLLEI